MQSAHHHLEMPCLNAHAWLHVSCIDWSAPQVYALTFLHSMVTMFGMWAFAAAKMFEVKQLKAMQVHLSASLAMPFAMPLAMLSNPSLCLAFLQTLAAWSKLGLAALKQLPLFVWSA